MKLSIVIVNYNVRYFLEQCLLSVEKALCGISGEVYVVDNNSSDDSMCVLKKKFPWVNYIENKENYGFSRANNQALSVARGEYVLLLNPDTIIGETTLSDCISFMDKTPDAGMCGVRMLKVDGGFAPESRRGVPTPFTAFSKMVGLSQLFPKSRLFGKYYMQYLDAEQVNEIEIISGAFMFIRKSALDKVGLLDETFFMYGEDIDISYRMLKAGYKNYYLPTSILHYKGESTKKSSFAYVNVFHRAMIIFFRKHFSHNNFFYEILINIAIAMKACISFFKYKVLACNKPKDPLRQEKFLFVSDGTNLSDMLEVADRNNIIHDVFHSSAREFPPTDVFEKGYDYIVFDTDRFPFTSILEFFRHQPNHKDAVSIATYLSSSRAIMVLHGAIK